MSHLEKFDEDFPLFIEAGFIAIKQLDEPGSRRLFTAARRLRPRNTAPFMGAAFICLNKLELDEAIELYSFVVEVEPENWMAWAFYGLSLCLKKENVPLGKEYLQKAYDNTPEEHVKNLAKSGLDWIDEELGSELNKG